ncbi:GNAT family N-acetyltransferase [Allokutzneria sp. A3M-2-11 16]|uniref:GNAT family N-acetyltransferase n=1 Tax=Allokutzneria sp. A3M-2-11 16 TaxID=2962043 RepID=UPI0020B6D77D|nr:GNAT family N-acetyltransferase [Allokutzneria sp. A3M-2-11 16]MCP3804310.1 GNAT family N-acetyltransferase [Allokutzneria sp. A3M-2-11 16]
MGRGARAVIVSLTEVEQFDQVAALFGEIWSLDIAASPVPAELMCALQLTGNYVAGAYAGSELVGAAVGFFDSSGALHSHVAGVRASARGRGVGLALKLHQRDWALARGITKIHWTFDPLVRRNAHFNLVKLGARPVRYLPNFYGPIGEGESDRFLVEWSLTSSPPPVVGPSLTIALPADIEALRLSDPASALRWRLAVREAVELAFAEGYAVTGMTPDGSYVLTLEAE